MSRMLLSFMVLASFEVRAASVQATQHDNTREAIHSLAGEQIISRDKRTTKTGTRHLWSMPIKYTFDPSKHTKSQKNTIRDALHFWEHHTCVRFEEVEQIHKQEYGIKFSAVDGCYSDVGRSTLGGQTLSLVDGCVWLGVIIHEIGHALGFFHEHTRLDRRDSIKINFDNIKKGLRPNFKAVGWGKLQTFGYPYDIGSVFQYPPSAFQINKTVNTIDTLDPLMSSLMGQRRHASFYDIKTANTAYCKDSCKGKKLNCQNRGYTDPNNCYKCICPKAFHGRLCERLLSSVGEDTCGGFLELTDFTQGTLHSPGFPFEYPKSQYCYWLLQGLNNTDITLRFTKKPAFGMKCGAWPRDCEDYVEVRYYSNIALAGPRFCSCNLPTRDIVSHGNQVLVAFESTYGGPVGFQATYQMAYCGGCGPGSDCPKVRACHFHHTTQCKRLWKVARRCKRGKKWTTLTKCMIEAKERIVACEQAQVVCCPPYIPSGKMCVRPEAVPDETHNTTSLPDEASDLNTSHQNTDKIYGVESNNHRRVSDYVHLPDNVDSGVNIIHQPPAHEMPVEYESKVNVTTLPITNEVDARPSTEDVPFETNTKGNIINESHVDSYVNPIGISRPSSHEITVDYETQDTIATRPIVDGGDMRQSTGDELFFTISKGNIINEPHVDSDVNTVGLVLPSHEIPIDYESRVNVTTMTNTDEANARQSTGNEIDEPFETNSKGYIIDEPHIDADVNTIGLVLPSHEIPIDYESRVNATTLDYESRVNVTDEADAKPSTQDESFETNTKENIIDEPRIDSNVNTTFMGLPSSHEIPVDCETRVNVSTLPITNEANARQSTGTEPFDTNTKGNIINELHVDSDLNTTGMGLHSSLEIPVDYETRPNVTTLPITNEANARQSTGTEPFDTNTKGNIINEPHVNSDVNTVDMGLPSSHEISIDYESRDNVTTLPITNEADARQSSEDEPFETNTKGNIIDGPHVDYDVNTIDMARHSSHEIPVDYETRANVSTLPITNEADARPPTEDEPFETNTNGNIVHEPGIESGVNTIDLGLPSSHETRANVTTIPVTNEADARQSTEDEPFETNTKGNIIDEPHVDSDLNTIGQEKHSSHEIPIDYETLVNVTTLPITDEADERQSTGNERFETNTEGNIVDKPRIDSDVNTTDLGTSSSHVIPIDYETRVNVTTLPLTNVADARQSTGDKSCETNTEGNIVDKPRIDYDVNTIGLARSSSHETPVDYESRVNVATLPITDEADTRQSTGDGRFETNNFKGNIIDEPRVNTIDMGLPPPHEIPVDYETRIATLPITDEVDATQFTTPGNEQFETTTNGNIIDEPRIHPDAPRRTKQEEAIVDEPPRDRLKRTIQDEPSEDPESSITDDEVYVAYEPFFGDIGGLN